MNKLTKHEERKYERITKVYNIPNFLVILFLVFSFSIFTFIFEDSHRAVPPSDPGTSSQPQGNIFIKQTDR